MTKPCAKNRSSADCAVMCGTPHVSRVPCPGALSPLTVTSPSICASACFASVVTSPPLCAPSVVAKRTKAAANRPICPLLPAPCRLPPAPSSLREQLLHLVHHLVHLLQRELQRLACRHVHAGILEQLDWILRSTRREERQVALCRGRIAGQHFRRERFGRGEGRG